MMNKTNDMIQAAEARAVKQLGYRDESEAVHYMYGFMKGFLNHLERNIPGVTEEIAREVERQQRKD